MNIAALFLPALLTLALLTGCTARFDAYQPSVANQPPGQVCEPYDLNPRQAVQLDCYVESARRQSLVNKTKE
ncbi:hypothetical protein [Sansalvadorimonas verongulae]|uniref:hypothetical protein n=1 Tax=Sansalvadorimonas verongulae TaxID=2172824 RepID=UPI0012BBAB1F|nr:hypothetical protein [Sansalvadorimonas verongulae]MTI15558.1 hypothetical protein [Sansalvadorimonas verongulae]